MSIPEEFVQELKMRTDIEDVISSYVTLKRSGNRLLGLCPFHREKTPSFVVNKDGNYFHCFGCGVGGDPITFIRKIENVDYVDALKILASRAGMTVPEGKADDGMRKLKNRILEANREAARFFYGELMKSPAGKDALSYLHGRQLTDKTIVHFGLGYSPPERYKLTNYLMSKGFKGDELIAANLICQSKNGYGQYFDRFSDRIMFPIMDLGGNVIAFGGRIMTDIKPKYLNTSETPVFNKRKNLFALNFAKYVVKGQLILVEGYMDVIALHQAGFETAVATLGTALTEDQARRIKQYCDEVVVCYDSDEAGRKATLRAIEILRPAGLKIKVMNVPNGKDPDEFIKSYGEHGPSRFGLLIEKAPNDIDYRLNEMKKGFDLNRPEQRVDFLTQASSVLASIDNPVERDVYSARLSDEMNVQKQAISSLVESGVKHERERERREYRRRVNQNLSAQMNMNNNGNLRAAKAEEAIITIMMINSDIADRVYRELRPEEFVTGYNRSIYAVLVKRLQAGKGISISDVSEDFTVEEMSMLVKLIDSYSPETNPVSAADTYISILREEGTKLSPEQIAGADNDTIMELIRQTQKKKFGHG